MLTDLQDTAVPAELDAESSARLRGRPDPSWTRDIGVSSGLTDSLLISTAKPAASHKSGDEPLTRTKR